MKVTELIEQLQILKDEYGEKEVYIAGEEVYIAGEEDIFPITQTNVDDLQDIFYVV
jgi:co-chaperonin GroES (HSP10)